MSIFLRATGILFMAHLRRTFFSKRALVAALLCCVPVLVALLVAMISRFEGPPPFDVVLHLSWLLQVPILVLVALIVGSAVVAEEIEDRTITYLFTRPIPRGAIVVGRYLAALVLVLVVLGTGSALVLKVLSGLHGPDGQAIELPDGFRPRIFISVLLGGAVYSAVFAALGSLVKRPVLVGLGYAFVIEALLGNLPGSNQKLTIFYYLKSFLLGGHPELLEYFEEGLVQEELVTTFAALRMLFLILVGGLALGAWRLTRREYVLAS